jgi:hypothetical protein
MLYVRYSKETGLLNYHPITLGTGHKEYSAVEIKEYDMGWGLGVVTVMGVEIIYRELSAGNRNEETSGKLLA